MRGQGSWNIRTGAVCEEGMSLELPKVLFSVLFCFYQECSTKLLQQKRFSAEIYTAFLWGGFTFLDFCIAKLNVAIVICKL